MAYDLGNAIAELRGSIEALRVYAARRAAAAAKVRARAAAKAELERELRRNAPPSPPAK